MPSSGMLCHRALVRSNVWDERIAYIIRMRRIGELRTTLAVMSNRSMLRRNTMLITVFLHRVLRLTVILTVVSTSPSLVTMMIGGDKFFRNVGSCKSHMA
jgi:hypothetical protein